MLDLRAVPRHDFGYRIGEIERVRQADIAQTRDGDFRLPLSQEQLADTLGLSAVHVSRTFSAFREQGLVLRERHHVTLPDPEALARVAEFDDCYLNDSVRPIFFDGTEAAMRMSNAPSGDEGPVPK